jgi:hypothetical protein
MNATRMSRAERDRQEAAKKWNDVSPFTELVPAADSLAALRVSREVCPMARARVDSFALGCGHYVGKDAAHAQLDDSSYYGRPSIECPRPDCDHVQKIATDCTGCGACRPYAWGCPGCGLPLCASCLYSNYCVECGREFVSM